ncbi:membrane spanning protein [Staphylococcus aureus]|nr:membrane spanning protein [Staphylococcus aureus]
MTIKAFWQYTLYQRSWLMMLLICNILGMIYGYIWYGEQLSHTPWHFKIFVPDSPTAILYLVISISLILIQKQNSIIDALAFVTLFKYGIWAVIMNILFIIEQGDITVNGLVLMFSHSIMAGQAIYFYPRFKRSMIGISVAMIWVFLNDYIDYFHLQFPYYDFITTHVWQIGVLSCCLSVFGLLLYIELNKLLKCK